MADRFFEWLQSGAPHRMRGAASPQKPRLLHSRSLSVFLRKSNVETPGVQKGRKLVQRRRNTCPSPQDISRALQNPSPAPSPTAASLDELIQRCLHCFGPSLSCSPLFITTGLCNGAAREREIKGSLTIRLCCVWLQKPDSLQIPFTSFSRLPLSAKPRNPRRFRFLQLLWRFLFGGVTFLHNMNQSQTSFKEKKLNSI